MLKEIPEGHVCRGCKLDKLFTSFYKDKGGKYGYSAQCKDCTKKFQANQAKARRHYYLQFAYGISLEAQTEMLTTQNGKCAICFTPIENNLNVDHDHTTGKVRGLLCTGCNLGLGAFKDSTSNLKNAIEYLERNHAG